MALATLVPFKGPKKSRFLGPSPLKCPSLWIVPPQNHFVPPHINTRYINSYSVSARNRCSRSAMRVLYLERIHVPGQEYVFFI
jgi:hypothetical protein